MTDMEILDLLERIDNGYEPSSEEQRDLENVRGLNFLSDNITALPDTIGNLTNLQWLSLDSTHITVLPDTIGNLINLQVLDLRFTRITALPDTIGNLSNLQWLILRDTQITALPDTIGNLSNLQVLDLNDTYITALPDWLGELPNLRRVDLGGLNLDRIPESLALKNLLFLEKGLYGYDKTGINLLDTTLTEQDKSIFLETPELIPSLYESQIPLRECKVIFLGDGETGKSYTIKRFRNGGKRETTDNPYITRETPGIDIEDYTVDRGGDSFTIHFWDFGGQQILHSIHRCFLTDETCYVVMVKNRDTELNRHAYNWLQNVTSFAPNSPVLLMVNCWDNENGQRVIDENSLRQEFPNIYDVVYCSAKYANNDDFRFFMKKLIDMVEHSNGLQRTVNTRWERTRKSILLESKEKNYLTKERYYEICQKCGIKDADAAPLLTFFNNLGVCFSYHRGKDRAELAEYKLLNPVWLTNAVYAIIEEGMSSAIDGRIKLTKIKKMLSGEAPRRIRDKDYRRTAPEIRYNDYECEYIIDVAAEFNLCWRIDDETLFFPAFSTTNTPVEELEKPLDFPNHMEYALEYEYLPDSVVHQLMVRCFKKDIAVNKCWLRGMVVGGMDAHKAIIRMTDDYKTLRIDIFSKPEQKTYDFFKLLKDEIDEINKRLNLTANEYIVSGEDRFSVSKLMKFYKVNQDVEFGDKTDKQYSVRGLLGMFYDDWTLRGMSAEDGIISIVPRKLNLHPCSKDKNPALRYALWEKYDGKCQYCNKPIANIDTMQVDHVLPENFRESDLGEVREFIRYLEGQGFDIQNPDYIENYLPAHGECNRKKTNDIHQFRLVSYSLLAQKNAQKVYDLMKKREKELNAK